MFQINSMDSLEFAIIFLVLILPFFIGVVVNTILIKVLFFTFKDFRIVKSINSFFQGTYMSIIGTVITMIVTRSSNNSLILFLTAFILMGIVSYLIVFRQILEYTRAIISSIIFGIISNPILWYLLFDVLKINPLKLIW